MKRTFSWMFMLALFTLFACSESKGSALALGAQAAAVNETPLVIDAFTTGFDNFSLVSGSADRPRSGSMLGGVRGIYFSVDAGPLQQPSGYTMNGAGGLVISSGLKSYWGAYLIYGVGYSSVPLDLHLSPYDMICLDFGSNDQPVSGGVEFAKDSAYATASWYAGPSTGAFSVKVPYAEFDTTTGSPLPWDGVSQVVVLLQTGSANAGNDLELTSITLGACRFPEQPPQ
jgi:hypothetical protein